MKIIELIKNKLFDKSPKKLVISEPVYAEGLASLICEDIDGNTLKSTKIIPHHVDLDADNPIIFPTFYITKTIAKPGILGMHIKKVMNLDTDDWPLEGSINLLTSGTMYNVI